MRRIADGVFEIPMGYVNAHLVVTDDGVVFVDTGLPRRVHLLEQALAGAGRAVGDVRAILLTHRHPDHVGTLAALRRRTGARMIAHAADVPFITGEQKLPVTGVLRVVQAVMGEAEPAAVDTVLTADGPTPVPGFTAVHTPGHTAGHVSYLLARDGGILFAGDAAAGAGTRVRHTPKLFTPDRPTGAASVAKLAALDFDIAVFGHGRAVRGRAVDRFRELVSGS